jgi:hypothetical protein
MTRDLTVARQMISADLLRLRKKRGVVALALLVVLVPIVIATGYDVIRHASDPAHYGPAGGVHYFGKLLDLLGITLGPAAAILIGAEAGVGDLAAGCSETTCSRVARGRLCSWPESPPRSRPRWPSSRSGSRSAW